jgi:hypothetical protein
MGQVGNWVLYPFFFFYFPRPELSPLCNRCFLGREVSPWLIITFWDLLQSILHTLSTSPFVLLLPFLSPPLYSYTPSSSHIMWQVVMEG